VSTLELLPAADLEALLASPTPTGAERSQPATAGSAQTERALIRLLEELLDITGVDREDNFFAVGGDSIVSVQLAARATAQGLPLTPAMVFEHMTIAALAAAVDAANEQNPGEPAEGSSVPGQQTAPMSASGLSSDALADLKASWQSQR
jgi:mycobactin peptide synthetase MbtE